MFLMIITNVYSYDILKEYNISNSSIPFSGNESFLLQLQENQTLYFNQGNITNNNITLSYPNNYTFPVNVSNYTLNINYLLNGTNITSNNTYEKDIFINNSLNNVTNDILFRFNVLENQNSNTSNNSNQNSSSIQNNTQVYQVNIISDGYNITISSNTLPKVGTLNFELTGFPNTQGQITYCGEFLTCPTTFNYDSNGKVTIPISYNIPYGQQVGTYTRVFAIQSNNTYKQGKIIFNIIPPQYVIQHYVYTDSCFVNKASMIKCVKEQQEFNSKQLSDFLNELLKKDKSTCPTINQTIKYVMSGEINQTMKLLYDNAIRDLNLSRTENIRLTNENKQVKIDNSKLMAEKDNLMKDSNLLVKQAQDEAFKTKIISYKNEKQTKTDYQDKVNFWTMFISISLVISIGVGYILYKHSKSNWW